VPVSLTESLLAVTRQPLSYSALVVANHESNAAVNLLENNRWLLCQIDPTAPYERSVLGRMTQIVQAYKMCIMTVDHENPSGSFMAGVLLGLCRAYFKPSLVLSFTGAVLSPIALHGVTAVCYSMQDLQFLLDTLDMKLGIVDIGTRLKAALSILHQSRGVL